MNRRRQTYAVIAPLLLGLVLLAVTLARTDTRTLVDVAGRLGYVLPLALLPSAGWHLVRTAAWHQSFPADARPSFARAFRIRLAAEAFSYVTVTGLAGDPLKVVLLYGEIATPVAAAAVALERLLYLLTTTLIVGIAAAIAVSTLPLSNTWLAIYAAVAIVPPILIAGAALWIRRRRARSSPAEPGSRVRRFLRELDGNLRGAVRNDPRRIARVAVIQAAAYATMALEVWTALRLTHTPITWIGALALETFTRVTSMATAFIPASIGALEASNVAGAAAVHAAAGGLGLALIRRVRGLAWCAAGFLVYPRRPRRSEGGETAVIIDTDSDTTPADSLGGLPVGERIARAAARAGYAQLLVWSPNRADTWRRAMRRAQSRIAVHAEDNAAEWQRRIAALPAAPVTAMLAQGLRTRDGLALAERRLRASIFKPTDGRLARLNRRLSIPISVALIRTMRMNANAMSIVIIALGLWAGWLFGQGSYATGLLAALVSWAASVLDGCDGELARLQYTESAFGCWVDTIGDYTYYVAIFAGLTVGSVRATGWTGFWWIGAALAAGLFLTFALLILLRGRITAGRPEQLNANTKAHFYRSGKRWKWLVAKLSNCATRATMPYGIVAFAVADLLPVVLVLAALGAQIYWISLAVELRRLLAAARPQVQAGLMQNEAL